MQDNQDKTTSTDEVQSKKEYKEYPCGSEVLRTRPDRPLGPHSPCTMRTVSLARVKRQERGVNHPPLS
jgi:hypothetical protein